MVGNFNEYRAETSFEDFQKYLVTQVKFENTDLSKLRKGELITKLFPVQDQREVAVCGIIPINTPFDFGLKTFQSTMERQNQKSILSFGSFSKFPKIEDISSLTLEKNDIEDLKKCRVGNCKLRLSADMINRFQNDVNWNAPDYSTQTTNLFRQMILQYVQDYLSRGNSALIEYRDQTDSVNLQKEQSLLLKKLIWINDFAPEISEYLQNFPHSEPPNTTMSIGWAKVKFGLKPVIIITQTLNYQTENNGISQILSVSKQIYANHYFDSSISLTAFIKFPQIDSTPNAFLLYSNHSRSSSFDGIFSKFKRQIVEQEAMENLRSLLQESKVKVESNSAIKDKTSTQVSEEDLKGWFSEQKYYILVGLVGLLTVIFVFIKLINNKMKTN